MKRIAVVLLGALTLALGGVWGQQGAGVQVDQEFVRAAATGDLYELTSSQMAQQQAGGEEVQAFAERMIADHSMTGERLTQIAQAIGVELPTMPDPAHQVMLSQLTVLQGAEFDAAYAQQQVLAHQLAVNLFRIAAETALDEQVRAFAQETLPALQEHLTMAQDLAQQVGAQQ